MTTLRQDDSPASDSLVGLWQSAPKPDPHRVLQDLQHSNRLHTRFYRSLIAILCGFAVLFIFEEATGRLATHGLISVLWILFVTGIVWRRRVRCKRLDALTMDTVSLLKSMIARAKRDLFIARCLYAGVPCGALAGWAVARLAGLGATAAVNAAHPNLERVQTGAGIAALILMMVAGVILARSRHAQVVELSEKLRCIESDL